MTAATKGGGPRLAPEAALTYWVEHRGGPAMPRNRIGQHRSCGEQRVSIWARLGGKWESVMEQLPGVLGSWEKTLQLCLIIFVLSLPAFAGAAGLILAAHGQHTIQGAVLPRMPPGTPGQFPSSPDALTGQD